MLEKKHQYLQIHIIMKEDNKKLGSEARKKRPQLGKIDENYNKTPKALQPKNNEARQVAKMTRKSLAYALEGQPVKIKMALDILFDEDPRAYIDAIAKLMNYAMPKLSSTCSIYLQSLNHANIRIH